MILIENQKEFSLIEVLKMNNRFLSIGEIYIPITIDNILDLYMISNYGNIYNKYTGEFLILYPCATSSSGKFYYSVNLKTTMGIKSYRVHRLVLACFYPEKGDISQKLDVNHKNGNKIDNFVSTHGYEYGNLEWCTRSENIKHAYENNLHHVGEDHANAKLTNEVAMQVIELLNKGIYTSKQICDIIQYKDLTPSIVDSIRKKESYKYLSKNYVFNQRPSRLFTESDIHIFCKSFQNHSNDNLGINDNCRLALIENNFEVSNRNIETLRKVYKRKYYKNIVSEYNW